jgi:DNA-binding CsgD family transcriptional regulator
MAKVVNPTLSILDKDETFMYTVGTSRGRKLNFRLKKMYKTIQLTDKELELLASMIQYYIDQKKNKPDFEINNAHIMLRHISGKLSHNNRNQIAFLGK